MIVSPQEYNSLVYRLADPNKFTPYLRIPVDEPIYDIDLKTREVEAPKFLSVSTDHDAEIIWFKTDRFYENFDLFNATILIQYINAAKEKYVYLASPIVLTEKEIQYPESEDKETKETIKSHYAENALGSLGTSSEQVLIPWPIGYDVAKATGNVEFSFQFFQLWVDENNKQQFSYLLNTLPAKSKVLQGMNNNEEPGTEVTPTPGDLQKIQAAIDELKKEFEIYWIEAQ